VVRSDGGGSDGGPGLVAPRRRPGRGPGCAVDDARSAGQAAPRTALRRRCCLRRGRRWTAVLVAPRTALGRRSWLRRGRRSDGGRPRRGRRVKRH